MKKIIYILILISAFAFNLEVKAEWIEKDGFFYMKDSLDAIRDFKISEDGEIIVITKDNQIIKYDFETGEIKKRCKCEDEENYNQFAFVSKDLKTTSIVYNFDTLNNENVAYNLAIINNDDCSRIVNQKMDIPKDYRGESIIFDKYKTEIKINEFKLLDFDLSNNLLIVCFDMFRFSHSLDGNLKQGLTLFFELNKNNLDIIKLYDISTNSICKDVTNNNYYLIGENLNISFLASFPQGFDLKKNQLIKYDIKTNTFENIENISYDTRGEFDKYSSQSSKKSIISFVENQNKFIIPLFKSYKLDQVYELSPYKYYNSKYVQHINKLDTKNTIYYLFSGTRKIDAYNDDIFYNNYNNYKIENNNILYYSYPNNLDYSNVNYDKSSIILKNSISNQTIDSIYLPFYYSKYEIYIPNKIDNNKNRAGGYIILKDSKLMYKKNNYINAINGSDFGISNDLIRIEDTLKLIAYSNVKNLKYKWIIKNHFVEYLFDSDTNVYNIIINKEGIYDITLQIYKDSSLISEIKKTNAIKILPKLIADFEIKFDKQYPDIIYLSSTSKGKITKYEWDLDNGQKSSNRDLAFKIINQCDYNIKLTIYDAIGSKSIVKNINNLDVNSDILHKLSNNKKILTDDNSKLIDLKINNDSLNILKLNLDYSYKQVTNDSHSYNLNFEIDKIILNHINLSIVNTQHLIKSDLISAWESYQTYEKYNLNNYSYIKYDKFIYFNYKNYYNWNIFKLFKLDSNYKIKEFSQSSFKNTNTLELEYFNNLKFKDSIKNLKIQLIRKDSSNDFEIFEINEKLELKRRDLSLPFDMEINEVKLINENKLAIVGHKKHQYTKGIGAIVILDLRDLSFVVKEHNSRPTINNLRKINNSYYYAFGDVIGSQGYMIFDANFDLVKDIRLTDLEGELKDVEYLDNKFYLATEEHYLDTITPFRIEDKYKIRLYMDSVEVDLSEDITSIESNNENNFLIFPNPSSEKITLDLGGVAVADLVVYDILGNEIISIPNYTNKSEIDISNLSIGTYTIQIQTNTGSVSQRLVVNR